MRLAVALAAAVLLGAAYNAEEPKPSPPSPVCYDIIDYDRKVVIVICIEKIREPDEPDEPEAKVLGNESWRSTR